MPQNFPPSLNILTYVATVLGADDSVQSVNTDKLPGRAIIACKENDSLYMLRKESTTTPSGTDVILPANGVGRWFLYPNNSGSSGFGVIRCDLCIGAAAASLTFAPGAGPTYDVVSEAGALTSVSEGDTLFVQPIQALLGFFHNADPAPQFGGVWTVVDKLDNQNVRLLRIDELSTSAQIDATALISVDGGSSPGIYQVATPAGGTIDVDAQVMPWVARPAPTDGDTYKLQASGGQLFWTLDPP